MTYMDMYDLLFLTLLGFQYELCVTNSRYKFICFITSEVKRGTVHLADILIRPTRTILSPVRHYYLTRNIQIFYFLLEQGSYKDRCLTKYLKRWRRTRETRNKWHACFISSPARKILESVTTIYSV